MPSAVDSNVARMSEWACSRARSAWNNALDWWRRYQALDKKEGCQEGLLLGIEVVLVCKFGDDDRRLFRPFSAPILGIVNEQFS